MAGSYYLSAEADVVISLYPLTRADGTSRLKLLFSKTRHCAPIDPLEVDRMAGANAFGWSSRPWMDNTSGKVSDEDKFISALERGPIPAADAISKSGLPKTTFYRTYDKLEKKGIVTRNDNVYFLKAANDVFDDGAN